MSLLFTVLFPKENSSQVSWKQKNLSTKASTGALTAERFSPANQRAALLSEVLGCVVTRRQGCPPFLQCSSRPFLERQAHSK